MTILAIDPGTRCGWAVLGNGTPPAAGLWDLSGSRWEGGGMRYLRFRKSFSEALAAVCPDQVVYEEVRRHLGTDAAHVYGGIVAELMATCELATVPYRAIPVATIKRRATGKGNAPKDAMLAEPRDPRRQRSRRAVAGAGGKRGDVTHRLTDYGGASEYLPNAMTGEPLIAPATLQGWAKKDYFGFRSRCIVMVGGRPFVDLDAYDRWREDGRGRLPEGSSRSRTPREPRRRRSRLADAVAEMHRIGAERDRQKLRARARG